MKAKPLDQLSAIKELAKLGHKIPFDKRGISPWWEALDGDDRKRAEQLLPFMAGLFK